MKRAGGPPAAGAPSLKRVAAQKASAAPPPAFPQCLRGVVAAGVGLLATHKLAELVRARGGQLVPLDVADRPRDTRGLKARASSVKTC